MLLGVIAGVISILPVGAPLVWIPAAIYLFAVDLIMENGECRGVVAINMADGTVHRVSAGDVLHVR